MSRFAKDKRVRTAAPKRASYNPHFTDDNRLKEQYSRGEQSERTPRAERTERPARSSRPFGSKPQGGKPFGGKPQGGKSFGGKTQGSKPFGKRSEGGFKSKPQGERKSYPKFNPNKQTGEIRLNRYVAQSGICSRREADELIAAGLVSINGNIVTELGTKVKPGDDVRFNGERIQGEQKVYLILNKPKGYNITSKSHRSGSFQ